MHNKNSRKRKLLLTVSVLLLFFFPAGAAAAEWPADAVVISPAPGTPVDSLLAVLGKAVVKYAPIDKWTVRPLGGPEVWLPMMKEGKCHFANNSVPEVLRAYQGRGVYEKLAPVAVRTVAAGHSTMFMFWTIPEKNITSINDLKGKRVFLKYKTNPLFMDMAQKQLAAAGLALADLKSVLAFSNLTEATRALMEGWADAILFPVVPGAVAEINQAKGECRFVPLTPEQAQYVVNRSAGYHLEDIPADDPRFGNKSKVPNAICYQNAMFCSPALDSEIAYGVAKAIFDHSDELSDAHPLAKYWSLTYRPVAMAVPYHDGALRYFKEKGKWTSEAQAHQDRMLKRRKN
jgi:TRAP transporter TAXI family solute receptor